MFVVEDEDVVEDVVGEDVEDEEHEAEEEERENSTVSRYRQFHVIAIFRLYDPSLFDLCARPGLEVRWKGGEAVRLHPYRYSRHPPLLYRKIRESRPHLPVEEYVDVTSARDPSNAPAKPPVEKHVVVPLLETQSQS